MVYDFVGVVCCLAGLERLLHSPIFNDLQFGFVTDLAGAFRLELIDFFGSYSHFVSFEMDGECGCFLYWIIFSSFRLAAYDCLHAGCDWLWIFDGA